jgi:hypothetical protein
MKWFLVLSMSSLILSSCGEKKSKCEGPECDENPKVDECSEISKNDVKPNEAIDYIWNFMKDDSCMKFAEKYGMIGFIPMSAEFEGEISLVNPYVGYSIYPCVDTTKNNSKLYFSMMRDVVCPGLEESLPIKDDDKFLRLAYLDQKIERFEVKDSLTKYLKDKFELGDYIVKGKLPVPNDVKEFNENYKRLFSNVPNYVNEGAGFVQRSSLKRSYYQTMSADLKIDGFVVFLGKANDLQTDQVRLVLIPLLNTGKLHLEENAICLERSWPPIGSKK